MLTSLEVASTCLHEQKILIELIFESVVPKLITVHTIPGGAVAVTGVGMDL